MIVGTDIKTNGVCRNQAVLAADGFTHAARILIDQWLLLNKTRSMNLNKEVTLRIKREALYAFKTKRDGIGVSARTHHEVIFEFALISVIDQIDPWIDAVIPYPPVCRNILNRSVTTEIVRPSDLLLFTRYCWI